MSEPNRIDNADMDLVPNNGHSDIDFTMIRNQQINFRIIEALEKDDHQNSECKGCKLCFKTEIELIEHLQRSHSCIGFDTQCCICKNHFKGERGLKIHLAKSKCRKKAEPEKNYSHCIPVSGGKSEVQTNQEKLHSVVSYQGENADQMMLENIGMKKPIKWPKMSDGKSWSKLEDIVTAQLPENFHVKKGINMLENILYEEAVKRFGAVEFKRRPNKLSRRQQQILQTKKEMNRLKKLYRNAADETEKAALACLQDEQRTRWKGLKAAENKRKRRWRRRQMRNKFFKDPFKAARDVLAPTMHSEPSVTRKELDDYLRDIYADENREAPLGELEGLPPFEIPLKGFDNSKFNLGKLQNVLKKKRNASRPGPNQIPYKVYKKCPKLAFFLLRLMFGVIRERKIPLKWRVADSIFIPKVDKPKKDELRTDFRQIALTNVEGKLFWSLVSGKLYKYLVIDNPVIDVSCQKGSIQKMAGCWEHVAMTWSALQDARKRKKSVSAIWLDLANAYGSLPHQLIVFALRRYGVPKIWIDIIASYYNGSWGRSTAGGVSSSWHRLMKGIFAGCTISVILFLAAMNVILEYIAVVEVPKYVLENGSKLPIQRAFMDDLSLMSSSVQGAQILLDRVIKVLKWARMQVKPSKSRSCVVKTGRCMDVEPFSVGSEKIQSIQKKPVKVLGRWINGELTDRKSKNELEEKFSGGMKAIDKSMLTGIMKIWVYQYLLLPRLSWIMMIYEIPVSWIELLECKASNYIRKWLGVSRNMTKVALYCKNSPCPLQISSLVSEYKGRKSSSLVQLQQSLDTNVKENVPVLKSGRKWQVNKAVEDAKSRIRLEKIGGEPQKGKFGLGYHRRRWFSQKGSLQQQARKEIVDTVKKAEDEKLFTKAIQQGIQGKWTKWQHYIQRDLNWSKILRSSPRLVSFGLGVTFDTLASPKNLMRMGLSDSSACPLCGKSPCDVAHILSGCPVSLKDGRYRNRHNAVLKVLAHYIQSELEENRKSKKKESLPQSIMFVREGVEVDANKKSARLDDGMLAASKDWVLLVDLDKQLKFPNNVCETSLRPDIVISSSEIRKVIIVELTCPSEENFEIRHQEKLAKYSELTAACKENGWALVIFAVEVGARGYIALSLRSCLRCLGLSYRKIGKLCKEVSDTALRSSFWIWMQKEKNEWGRETVVLQREDTAVHPVSSLEVLNATSDYNGCDDEGILQGVEKAVHAARCASSVKNTIDPSEKLLKTENFRLGTRGMQNVGNFCYMNAVIQCLSVVENFLNSPLDAETRFVSEYEKLITMLRERNKIVVSPTYFKRSLGNVI